MPWRKKGERPSRDWTKARLYIAPLIVVLLVLIVMLTSRNGGVDIGLGPEYNLGPGTVVYGPEGVVFTFTCVAPQRIDFDHLEAEIVLLSDDEVVSVVSSNGSVSAQSDVIPQLRVFDNVTMPHEGYPMEGMGMIVTLTYKGRLGAQYIIYQIPWDDE